MDGWMDNELDRFYNITQYTWKYCIDYILNIHCNPPTESIFKYRRIMGAPHNAA